MELSDFVKAPNQSDHADLYEIENNALDRRGTLWETLQTVAPWDGRRLVDLGCGTGFWLTRYREAASVVGVEPDETLLERARARGAGEVLHGSAEHIPLPDNSIDVMHARFAYYFPGPHQDCDPGLREAGRVLAPGGSLVVIDNDTVGGEFAELLRNGSWTHQQGMSDDTGEWWRARGASVHSVASAWEFDTRADLEAVLRMEFTPVVADPWLESHPDRTHIGYQYMVYHWQPHT